MERTLAFDTSNQPLSVALFEDETLLAERESNINKNHSSQLMPDVDALMQTAGWQPQDLTQVVVSAGPGSYTGLRIGVTTAKTLAYTLGLRLFGISSLALLAENVTVTTGTIVALMDARNDNLYAGMYQRDAQGQLTAVWPDQHTNLTKLLAALADVSGPIYIVGEWARFADALNAADLNLEFAADNLPHARHALALTAGQVGLTEMVDIHQFVPQYHRLSQAEADWAKANPDAETSDYVEHI